MTSTTSGRGRTFMDFENHRNQEWLRRRRLRLEQVRKQSNEIAKALREKIIRDEKARLEKYDRMSQARFRDWKAEKLEELENKLRCALEEFGLGYKLAEEEPDPEEVIEMGNIINMAKAQKRGEIAKQEELKMKKMAEEKKMSAILRKQLTRKKEDLRSALLRSVSLKKQLTDIHAEACEGKIHSEKVPVKKVRKKKISPHKSCLCRHKTTFKPHSVKDDRVWINLNELQHSSTGESGLEAKSSKSTISVKKNQKVRPEGMIEFYDFSSRYYCKSFKEYPHLVEKIDLETEVPNANELAELENNKEQIEAEKRLEADALSQERGLEALRREKIRRDYNNLITRLEELHKKEKILKSQQPNFPNYLHMTDERLSERERTKQRIMDTKFERIYYAAIDEIPQTSPPPPEIAFYQGGGDHVDSDEWESINLSFSSPNLKPNTPVTSDVENSEDFSFKDMIQRRKKTENKRQLLVDIDNALKKGRELRKTISRNWDLMVEEEEKEDEENKEDEKDEEDEDEEDKNKKEIEEGKEEREEEPKKSSSEFVTQWETIETSPRKDGKKMTKSQESQTEDLEGTELKTDKGDDSIPASSATSYKSPPAVIRSCHLREFLDYLEGVSEMKDANPMQKNSKIQRCVDELLYDLLPFDNDKLEKAEEKPCESPTLEYYIEKLLDMSRECIANLSVSSDNFSTPNITDLDLKEVQTSEAEYFFGEEENLDQKSKLERADQLEESIRNWKAILGKNSEKFLPEVIDVPDGLPAELSEDEEVKESDVAEVRHSEIQSRYEEITKKCSERISELSNMLEKVRKDKEKLLGSTSGGSSLSLKQEQEPPVDNVGVQERLENPIRSLVFEQRIYSISECLPEVNRTTEKRKTPSPTSQIVEQAKQTFGALVQHHRTELQRMTENLVAELDEVANNFPDLMFEDTNLDSSKDEMAYERECFKRSMEEKLQKQIEALQALKALEALDNLEAAETAQGMQSAECTEGMQAMENTQGTHSCLEYADYSQGSHPTEATQCTQAAEYTNATQTIQTQDDREC